MRSIIIRPPLKLSVPAQRHPSDCHGQAWSQEMRLLAVQRDADGMPRSTVEIQQLQLEGKYPSNRSIDRWKHQLATLGHVRPFRRTGNKRASRELKGQDLFNLAFYRTIKPKATLYECKTFIFNANPVNLPYSNSQIHRAEQRLNLTRKAASTTAYEAYSERILIKRHNYWNMPPPFGIVGVDPRNVIDIDEMGLEVEHSNRKRGKSVKGMRCNEPGTYNRNQKMNVLVAICGCDVHPARWVETWTGEGTTIYRYHQFITNLLDELDVMFPGRSFCFTKDNLNTHKNPHIINLIEERGHLVVFRAPYWAVDGAIEYVFNTVHSLIDVRHNNIGNVNELEVLLRDTISEMGSFRPYFEHVGFKY